MKKIVLLFLSIGSCFAMDGPEKLTMHKNTKKYKPLATNPPLEFGQKVAISKHLSTLAGFRLLLFNNISDKAINKERNGYTPLEAALWKKDFIAFQHLLILKARVRPQAFDIAIQTRAAEKIFQMLDTHSDDQILKGHDLLLFRAIFIATINKIKYQFPQARTDIIDTLLKKGCNINAQRKSDGNTPLHFAIAKNAPEAIIFHLLEKHSLNVFLTNDDEHTAKKLLEEKKHKQELLLQIWPQKQTKQKDKKKETSKKATLQPSPRLRRTGRQASEQQKEEIAGVKIQTFANYSGDTKSSYDQYSSSSEDDSESDLSDDWQHL